MERCERCNQNKPDVSDFEISPDWIARFCQQCQREYREGKSTDVRIIEQTVRYPDQAIKKQGTE